MRRGHVVSDEVACCNCYLFSMVLIRVCVHKEFPIIYQILMEKKQDPEGHFSV